MKARYFVPVAVLALAVACTENSSTPVENNRPQFAAGGGSPHFISSATSCSQVGNNLVCPFKEAGLSSGQTVTIQVSVSASATYVCLNNGGSVPSDQKKTSIVATVVASGSFTVGKSGNVQDVLTATPPGPGTFRCPNGQTVTGPTDVSYTPVAHITDTSSGASLDISAF